MNFPEALALGVLMIGVVSVTGMMLDGYKTRITNRLRELEFKVRLKEAEAKAQDGAVPEMEQRVRVLERIATDRGGDLAMEIDRLRSQEPVQ